MRTPGLPARIAAVASVIFISAMSIRTIDSAMASEGQRSKAVVVATLDDLPEGLAVSADGTLYASLLSKGQVVRLRTPGQPEVVGHVLPPDEKSRGATLGIDIGPDENLYVVFVEESRRYGLINFGDPANPECRDATVRRTGIYRMDPKTGVSRAVVSRADGWAFCFLDDIAVSRDGTIYTTDMTFSGIWKISPDGRRVEMWAQFSPAAATKPRGALSPTGAVNPIVLDEKNRAIYIGTILNGMVVRIPILADGTAGEPEAVAEGFGGLDGLEIDKAGDLIVSDNGHSEIWRLSLDGRRTLIADRRSGLLSENSNLAWWRGRLCAANTEFTKAKEPSSASRTIVCVEPGVR